MNQPARQPDADEDRLDRSGGPSDPKAVEGKKKRSEQLEARRLNGLRQIMNQADTRLWLWKMLDFCGIHRSSFTGNSTTFFNEGQRNVGLKIEADLAKHFPAEYVKMLQEGDTQNA